ncbi:hypothetical protein [Microbulbifer celer]|uniref:Secreted protein n=1 Tax=Microbulbifer celer TaxID=435905 RepID=A0ABW3U760_9GAMM|nr:hypothetical protein [Microbulbifer celer]UFN58551.1 hypothetical protein LPW13_05780 [Microbulbifer celer]
MKFNLSTIVAYFVALTRWVTALFPEPSEVAGEEVAAIRKRCQESFRKWHHCEHPYPATWPLRRGLWVEETCNLVRESLSKVVNDPEYLTADCVREVCGDDDDDGEDMPLPPAPVPEEEFEEELPQAARLIQWNGEFVHV